MAERCRMVGLLGLSLLVGCVHELDDGDAEGVFACTDDSDCETGFRCAAGYCYRAETPVCGDGHVDVDAGEDCDDGNRVDDGNGCSSTCQRVGSCGDGNVQDLFESCDSGSATTEACAYGETECVVCNGQCERVAGVTSFCGDGAVDTDNGESCDDGGTADGDGCNAICLREPGMSCGADSECASADCGDEGRCRCDPDYALDEGVCVSSKSVPCLDEAPLNATSVFVDVQIVYDATTGWSEPAACAWSCMGGYVLEDGGCINEKPAPCDDQAPDHATSIPADVTITYSEAGGWSPPQACEWRCDANYDEYQGECVNYRVVSCRDEAPDHATSTSLAVVITYSDETGWSEAPACAWTCNSGYVLDDDACINSRMVPCVDEAPQNATSVIRDCEIMYDEETGWSEPEVCQWTCNAQYYAVGPYEGSDNDTGGSRWFGGDDRPESSPRNEGTGQSVRLRYSTHVHSFGFEFFCVRDAWTFVLHVRDENGTIVQESAVDVSPTDTWVKGWVDWDIDLQMVAHRKYYFTAYQVDGYASGRLCGIVTDYGGGYPEGGVVDATYNGVGDEDDFFADWGNWSDELEGMDYDFRIGMQSSCVYDDSGPQR